MIVPVEEQFELSRHSLVLEGDHEEPRALILHGLNASLENGDASVLADCARYMEWAPSRRALRKPYRSSTRLGH